MIEFLEENIAQALLFFIGLALWVLDMWGKYKKGRVLIKSKFQYTSESEETSHLVKDVMAWLEADRVMLYKYHEHKNGDFTLSSVVYDYHHPMLNTLKHTLTNIPISLMVKEFSKFKNNEMIIMRDINTESRDWVYPVAKDRNLKSSYSIGIYDEVGNLVGALSVNYHFSQASLDREQISKLKEYGNLISKSTNW